MKATFLFILLVSADLSYAGGWVSLKGEVADKILSATNSPSLCGNNQMALTKDISSSILKSGSVFFTNMGDWKNEYWNDAKSNMSHTDFVAKWTKKFKSALLYEIDSKGNIHKYPAIEVQVGASPRFIDETTEASSCYEACKGEKGGWVKFEGNSAFMFSLGTGSHLLYAKQGTTIIREMKNPLFCFHEKVRLKKASLSK